MNALAKREPWGPNHHMAKLSTAQVDAIRDAYERGEGGYVRLSQRFGVSKSTVRDLCNYRRRCRG